MLFVNVFSKKKLFLLNLMVFLCENVAFDVVCKFDAARL